MVKIGFHGAQAFYAVSIATLNHFIGEFECSVALFANASALDICIMAVCWGSYAYALQN